MKRCPKCFATYAEESLRFCRVDGAALVKVADDAQATLPKLPSLNERVPDTGSLTLDKGLPRLSQITFSESIEEYPAWLPNSGEIVFSRER